MPHLGETVVIEHVDVDSQQKHTIERLAAIVTGENDDGTVSLCVFKRTGATFDIPRYGFDMSDDADETEPTMDT